MSAFISYSHQDRALARRLSKVMAKFGLHHWWDDHLALSTPWNDEVHRRLRDASSVVVLWTPNSCGSSWVIREATIGSEMSKLIQVQFVQTPLPTYFSKLQAANVPRWENGTFPRGIRNALNEVARRQAREMVLPEYPHICTLRLSSEKVSEYIDSKKHYEGYFPKLDGPLFKDIWEMQMSGEMKLYDELHPGSRHDLEEERYYELLQYLSCANDP